ncbi:bacteriochlorophyll 4-vinyl reductase [Caldichromatium japonicum]|uniref:bacteriochlorophyll 4-vinyl reductase n=1 Tax=Caldichromatium japonicum TaxID=2699430 RepID=UPI00140C90D7|nr:bacteriochlorophyll 4-vinyl reductase [Caldichromatium japonicum]
MKPDNQGRIGPNAIIRIHESLIEQRGRECAEAVFKQAELPRYLAALPETMVPEAEVIALHQALRVELGVVEARAIGRDAGRRTGDYLLACRIPKPAQWLLKHLPAPLAAPLLLKAIAANAWTFVGTGRFTIEPGSRPSIRIDDSPLCRGAQADVPLCDFYAGTFECLLQTLVHPGARVTETQCAAQGAPYCRFALSW